MIGWEILWSRVEQSRGQAQAVVMRWAEEESWSANNNVTSNHTPSITVFCSCAKSSTAPCFFYIYKNLLHSRCTLFTDQKFMYFMNRSPSFIAYSNRMEGRRWFWVRHVSRPSAGLTLRLAGEGVRWCIIVSDTRNHFIISCPAQPSTADPPHPHTSHTVLLLCCGYQTCAVYLYSWEM